MSLPADDLTETKLRDRADDDLDTVVEEETPFTEEEDSPMSGPYLYYESRPDRDDEETRRIVRLTLNLLFGPSDPKQ